MNRERYFDNAATTPLDPDVLRAMRPFLEDEFGNAHSLHQAGRAARAAVEDARAVVAEALGAEDPSQIVFVSGATEANNWILHRGPRPLYISPFEHSSVREPALRAGAKVVANEGYRLLGEGHGLWAVMLVNNETGAVLDVPPGASGWVHRDLTQAVGKVEFDLAGVDSACFSAHKIYGPKGIGAMYLADPFALEPYVIGGEQEDGRRGGTLDVAGIVGLAEALRLAIARREEDAARARACREAVLAELAGLPDWQVNDGPNQSPFILSLSFPGIEGETLVIEMDAYGFAISSGAACSSRSTEPSHVLTALGLSPDRLRGTVRLSFGRFSSPEAAGELGRRLATTVRALSSTGKGQEICNDGPENNV